MKPFYVISGFVAFLAALISVVVYFTGAQTFGQLVSVVRGEPVRVAPVPGQPQASTAPAPNPGTIELEYWRSISSANNTSAYNEYLRRYPHGQFASIAKQKIEELRKSPPAAPTPVISNPFTGGGSDSATPFHSDAFEFELTVPAHWAHASAPYDTARLRLMPPDFMSSHSDCAVAVKDVDELSKSTQDSLNASVVRGEGMDVIRRDALSIDARAAVSRELVVDVGALKGQQADAVFINQQGIRMHVREIMVFVPGRSYSIACGAPETIFAANEKDFRVVLDSFRVTGH